MIMNIYKFMSENPYLTFFLVLIISQSVVLLLNRIMRHLNIWRHGYPTAHCDADGDFRDINIK